MLGGAWSYWGGSCPLRPPGSYATADAPSYRRHSPVSVLDSGTVEKKRVYYSPVEDRRGNFTPFVLAVDGLLQHEVSHFVKRLSASLASRWEKPFSDVLLLSTFDYSLLQCALPACVCKDL